LKLPPNWNHGSDAEPHVGSIMLVPELLVPIAVFALLENGCKEVWKVENQDRKSTRLNSSHITISYAVFCLKKKKRK